MLIEIKQKEVITEKLSELQKIALEFLPKEQVTKFSQFQDLIEAELQNEAQEPEMENRVKDIFNALHERNAPKLLRALQGDKKEIFYGFKKQLEKAASYTVAGNIIPFEEVQKARIEEREIEKLKVPYIKKNEAKILKTIKDKELSLLTISTIR